MALHHNAPSPETIIPSRHHVNWHEAASCAMQIELRDTSLVRRLADDYTVHKEQDIYTRYLHQLTIANIKTKGERPMVCEGLFNLFGTSSEEIIARTKMESDAYYLPKINELTATNDQLSTSISLLSSQVDYLKNLLKQNIFLLMQNRCLIRVIMSHSEHCRLPWFIVSNMPNSIKK